MGFGEFGSTEIKFTLEYYSPSLRDCEFFEKDCNLTYHSTIDEIKFTDRKNNLIYTIIDPYGVLFRGEYTPTSEIRYKLEGFCRHVKQEKKEDESTMIKKMISVKFPDNRGRYTGKEYIYEILDTLSLPTKSSHIHIKTFTGGEHPVYDTKSLLVTDTKMFQNSPEEVCEDIKTYYGIPNWRVITDYELVSEVRTSAQELSDLINEGAEYVSETITDWEDMEEKCLSGLESLKPLYSISTVANDSVIVTDQVKTGNSLIFTGADGIKYKWDISGIARCDEKLVKSAEKSNIGIEKTIMEDKKMGKNMFEGIMKNFHFGKVDTDKIAFSMSGMAFKNSTGDYIVYNEDGTATNVSTLAFQMPLFAMPTSLTQIKAGDVIVHNAREFVVVKEITKTAIIAITPDRNELITIVPEKSIFGFDFYTKIVCPMTMMADNATSDNPFGNMLPFMLMENGDMDKDTMMMMMMMVMGNQNQNQSQNMMMMLPMIAATGKTNGDMMGAMMMAMTMSGQIPFVQATVPTQE